MSEAKGGNSRKRRLITLIIVGAFLGGGVLATKSHKVQEMLGIAEPDYVEADPVHGAEAGKDPRPAYHADKVLCDDGSLNIFFNAAASRNKLSDTIDSLGPVPAEILAAQNPAGPQVFFYPFLDASKDGVGTSCSAGWHEFGNALLALETDAIPLSVPDTLHLGGIVPGDMPKDTTDQWWAEHIRADKLVPPDAIVVSGRYGSNDAGKIVLHTWTLTGGSSSPAPLTSETLAANATLADFLSHQRAAGQKIIAELLKQNIVPPRPSYPAVPTAIIESELGKIITVANAPHTWCAEAAQERALALARACPRNHAALQAVAYCLKMRLAVISEGWAKGIPAYETVSRQCSAMAQVSLILEPGSQADLYLLISSLQALLETDPSMASEQLPAFGLSQPWDAWRKSDTYNFPRGVTLQEMPLALIFSGQARSLLYFGRSLYDQQFEPEMENAWKYDSLRGPIEEMSRREFGSQLAGAGLLTGSSLIDFFTVIATTRDANGTLLAQLKHELPPDLAIDTEKISEAAKVGESDRFHARPILGEALGPYVATALGTTYEDESRAVKLLTAARKLRDEAKTMREAAPLASHGFNAFAMTPGRRIDIAWNRLAQGPDVYQDFAEDQFGSPDDTAEHARLMKPIFSGDSPVGYLAIFSSLSSVAKSPGAYKEALDVAIENMRAHPRDAFAAVDVLEALINTGDAPAVVSHVEALGRSYRFRAPVIGAIARGLKELGAPLVALPWYERMLVLAPARSDLRNEMNWLKISLGDESDLESQFQDGINRYVGNPKFHEDLFRYYIERKQWDKAEAALEGYASSGGAVDFARVKLLNAKGDIPGAKAMLAKASKPQEMKYDQFYLESADWYIALGDWDAARKESDKVGDKWRGNSIVLRGALAEHDKDWAALKQAADDVIGRYGFSDWSAAARAKAVWNAEDKNAAVTFLEAEVDKKRAGVEVVATLAEFYLEAKNQEGLEKLAIYTSTSPFRNNQMVRSVLTRLLKLDDASARRLQKEISAGIQGATTMDELGEGAK